MTKTKTKAAASGGKAARRVMGPSSDAGVFSFLGTRVDFYSTECYTCVVRAFVQKQFDKWAIDSGVSQSVLLQAATEALAGQVDGDLGGFLFKKRIARVGGGKSGGFRTILCFRKANSDRIFFLYGFPKNDKGNISAREEKSLKLVGKFLVNVTEAQLDALVDYGEMRELKGDSDEETQ